MAPWTHTYLSPQTERRLCCASRETAQSFKQYIDSDVGSGKYHPLTLEQHWNSDHMRSVRRRMMAGENLPECSICDQKLLNTNVYRDYFWQLFKHKFDEVIATTDETGFTTMKPVSWDYRFSNLCNFKCRTCGDMCSSSWETEQKQHGMVNWNDPKNAWMHPDVRPAISKFQDEQVEAEFAQAVEEHRVEEIYWVGGEPLMYEQHWRYMKRIIELGDGHLVYARYNTNLSRIEHKGINLYNDILKHVRDWQICASIDGTGAIGEYIRTGLDFEQWKKNFAAGLPLVTHERQMRLDFTLTLPGLFEIRNMLALAEEFNVPLLAKVVLSFSPDIIMSPLSLPRHILDRKIDEVLPEVPPGTLRDVLLNLKTRPVFSEQWPDTYKQGLFHAKSRVLRIERVRQDTFTMSDILSQDPEIYDWWKNIDAN